MIYLKAYRIFERNIGGLNQDQIEFLNKGTIGEWEYNESTGLVDIHGDFNCHEMGLKDLMGIKFGVIEGNFVCSRNKLVSMEGMPQRIYGQFNCNYNEIVSFEEAPLLIKSNAEGLKFNLALTFRCSCNNIKSFRGLPNIQYEWLDVSQNKISSFEWAPDRVQDFNFGFNPIPSFEGAPEVLGDYQCNGINVESLEGVQQKINGSFYCSYLKIKDLRGGPQEVRGFYVANHCELESVKGGPIKAGRGIHLDSNKLLSLEELAGRELGEIMAENNPASEAFLKLTASAEWINMDPKDKDSYITIQKLGMI